MAPSRVAPVSLTVGGHSFEVGELTSTPDSWPTDLADLLRFVATAITTADPDEEDEGIDHG